MSTDALLIHQQVTPEQTISVFEQDNLRWLSFGDGPTQSIIDLENPGVLPSPAYRAMLAALFFIPTPKKVCLLGTGGGALARYLQHHQPTIHGDAVEISETIADIARRFFEFPTRKQGWQLQVTDARDYIRNTNHLYDLIVLDIPEGQSSPDWITNPDVLSYCRKRLSPGAALVINIMADNAEIFSQALWNIRQAFDQITVCLDVPEHKNILVFAFNGHPKFTDAKVLDKRAPRLKQRWGLEFDEFLERMKEANPAGSGIF